MQAFNQTGGNYYYIDQQSFDGEAFDVTYLQDTGNATCMIAEKRINATSYEEAKARIPFYLNFRTEPKELILMLLKPLLFHHNLSI